MNHPIVNAKGFSNGFEISGAKAAGASVSGFVVENATDEGILLLQSSHITVARSTVRSNDLGMFAAKPTGECAPQGQVPGDCGEGLHLMSSSNDRIIGNNVHGNAGGILLTDEVGPTHDNTIRDNVVSNNAYDCGITIAGHSPKGFVNGKLQPGKGGIFRNQILHNTANGNGLKGQGAGIVLAGAVPGSAVYDNLVQGNTANGNGLGGLTLHSHAPGQDLNGNRILNNSFAHDALKGGANGQPGDVDTGGPAGLTKTAGIIVFSAVTPLKGTVISGNQLANEYYGIWTQNVPKLTAKNFFAKSVHTHVYQR